MVEGGLVAGETGNARKSLTAGGPVESNAGTGADRSAEQASVPSIAPAALVAIDAEFARLSDRALDRCYSLAGYLLGDAAEAEDAAQDAMARAWRARASLRDFGLFDAWLDRILVNTCMDRMRRRRLVRFVDLDSGGDAAAPDPFRDLIAGDAVGRAVAGLKPELRAVVVLRFWRDLTVDQIAGRLGCPAGTVKSRLHAAIGSLRSSLALDAQED